MKIISTVCFGVVLVALLSQVLGHSYLTNPISRSNQKESQTGCRGPTCLGPCDRSRAATTRAPIQIQRGAAISIEWPRNNHAGGFIRLAWASTINSDSHSAFDAGIQQISCHEDGGCKPDNVNDLNGGDSGPADGSFQPCKTTITVPKHLTNGAWTLQWSWFGGAFALGDYYSCVDYTITGGPTAAAEAPVFKGGDFTYPGQQKCKFFNTDRLHACVNEPCNNPVYPSGERSGTPFFGNAVVPTPVTPAPVTPAPTPASPVTSARATTGRTYNPPAPTPASPVTSAAATTGRTYNPPAPTPSGGAVANCAGWSTMSSSSVTITNIETWRTNFLLAIKITVTESILANWRLQVIYPPSANNAEVNNVYNAGSLSCQSNSYSNRHFVIQPVGNWAKNIPQGGTIDIEVEVRNAGTLTEQQILNGIQLKLYKS